MRFVSVAELAASWIWNSLTSSEHCSISYHIYNSFSYVNVVKSGVQSTIRRTSDFNIGLRF